MPTSKSVAGKAVIKHEAGDTLRRTIILTTTADEVPIDLTGATIEFIISNNEDGDALHTLTVGDGLEASDLVNGEFKINWQTAGNLEPHTTYWYKLNVTYPGGIIKTYLESKIRTR